MSRQFQSLQFIINGMDCSQRGKRIERVAGRSAEWQLEPFGLAHYVAEDIGAFRGYLGGPFGPVRVQQRSEKDWPGYDLAACLGELVELLGG